MQSAGTIVEKLSDTVWDSQLLCEVERIVFPWPTEEPLNGNEVGRIFFLNTDAYLSWSKPSIKSALMDLAAVFLEHEVLDDLITAGIPADVSDWRRLMGAILLLDQAPRYLCKGTNAHYVYHCFDTISVRLLQRLFTDHRDWFTIAGWQVTGLSTEQAVLRILMLLAPLVHSEELSNQQLHIALVNHMRAEFESLTRTHDPYRKSFSEDFKDTWLCDRLLTYGPPQGDHVAVSDFVYWHLRYYTSHSAYVTHFCRSPFRNVVVGRDDTLKEVEWLQKNGVCWTDKDEIVRQAIKRDIAACHWAPLIL